MPKWYLPLLVALALCATSAQAQSLLINEFLADPAVDAPGDANGDGTRDSRADEFVELLNVGRDTLDLTGWRVGDDETVSFTFPDGYRLAPQEFVVLFGGGDVSAVPGYDADPLETKVFAVGGDGVGNGLANGGETIVLLSPDGSDDTYLSYGSRVGEGAPTGGELADVTFEHAIEVTVNASADQSVTRSPDGDVYAADPWMLHSDVRTALFSPGTTLDGETKAPRVSPPPTIVFNEILADPSTDPVLGDANGDGVRSSSGDEFVELANVSEAAIDLSGWTLGDDESSVTFTFPDGYILPSRAFVTIFGGGDVSSAVGYDADPLQTRAFVVDSTHLGIGNGLANSGDIIMLLSPDGMYDTYVAYGSLANTGGPEEGDYPEGTLFEVEINTAASAGSDNSITRFPDGNTNVEDPFVQHLSVTDGLPFSPGTTIGGGTMLPPPQPPVTVVINEILADATTDANGDGSVDALADQFIELVNTSETMPVDLSGFSVGDASGTTFTFPEGYRLAPLSFVAVFGGGDVTNVPGYNADPMMTRAFAASGALGDGLDAAGDIAVLRSPDDAYDAYVAFGNSAGTTPTGASWEFALDTEVASMTASSMTREPDGTTLELDPFAVHSDVSEMAYSPAQTTNGLDRLGDFVDVPHPWGTGQALAFEWWERDRVEIRDASSLLPPTLRRGTIEMWFKPDSVITSTTHPPDWTYLFSKNLGGNNEGDLGIGFPRGEGRLDFFMQDGETTASTFSSEDINDTFYPRWYHVAATWNADAGVMRLFIDGELVDEEPSTMALAGGVQQIAIGGGSEDLWNSRFESFRGQIDEVRFSAIDRYEADFELPTEPFTPDVYTIALWHFDEGSGDVAADATGNGFTGMLGGFDADGEPDPASAPNWVDLSLVTAVDDDSEVGDEFALDQNFPNPFGGRTTIRFNAPRAADVELHVFNVLGQRVATLADGRVPAGSHTLELDASGFASGVYFYVLQTDDVRLVQRMVVVR